MNILVIDDEWPALYSGKALRVINVFKKMEGRHQAHFLYIGDKPPVNTELIKDIFSSIDSIYLSLDAGDRIGRILNLLFLKPGDYAPWRYRKEYKKAGEQLQKIVEDKKIDIIQNFSYFFAQYAMGLNGCAKIWDVADSLYLTLRRKIQVNKLGPKALLYAQKLFNYEDEIIKKYDKTVFVSASDAEVHGKIKKRTVLVPNGVDLDYFSALTITEDYPSVVFTGHMSFNPNVEAVLYFVKEILPLVREKFTALKFYIVGAEPNNEIMSLNGKDGIIVTGFVDDVRSYLAKASVFVSPMVNGSGIKNKILQAMAMRKPIISTTLGVEAIKYKADRDVIIADTPQEFAARLIQLLENKEKRDAIAGNGRQLVEKEYSWDMAVDRYEALYKELMRVK